MDRLFFYFPQNLTGFPQKSQELSTAFNQLSTVFRLLAAFFAWFSTKAGNSIHTFEKLSTAFWLFIHILFAPVWCFTGIYPQVNRPFFATFPVFSTEKAVLSLFFRRFWRFFPLLYRMLSTGLGCLSTITRWLSTIHFHDSLRWGPVMKWKEFEWQILWYTRVPSTKKWLLEYPLDGTLAALSRRFYWK